MFQLLAPFWFVGLAALAVPVAIHLWNKKPGKVIKVGSIKWLQTSENKRLRSIKVTDIGLLLLRCLLLAVLVLALTQPRWLRTKKNNPPKLVLISPEVSGTSTLKAYQPAIDSLLKQGFTLRLWHPGFPELASENWQQHPLPDSLLTTSAKPANYWRLLRDLDGAYPNAACWLFAPAQLKNFSGHRPAIASQLTWVPVEVPQPKTWLQAAFLTEQKKLLLLVGQGVETGISYTRQIVPFPAAGKFISIPNVPDITVTQQENQLWLQLKNTKQKITVRQQPIYITIITDKDRAEDVRVLQAALQAIQDFTQVPLSIYKQKIPATPDWIFWLSDKPLPANVLQQAQNGAYVWQDAPAESAQTTRGWFTGFLNQQRFILSKKIALTPANSLWQDNTGAALLTYKNVNKGRLYAFGSRFHPDWSTLAASDDFPELLLPLLFNQTILPDKSPETRIMAEDQIHPIQIKQTYQARAIPITSNTDMRVWLLLLALLLFLSERIWSSQKFKAAP